MHISPERIAPVVFLFAISACDGGRAPSNVGALNDDNDLPEISKDIELARACYGDRIDLALQAGDGEVLLAVPVEMRMRLSPRLSHVNGGSSAVSQWRRKCHNEPVPVAQYSYVFNNTPYERLGLSEGFVIDRLIVSGYGEALPDFVSEFQRGYGVERLQPIPDSRFGNELVETEFGFLYDGPGTGAGFYLWPMGYRFPNGDKFALSCAPVVSAGLECRVSYQPARYVAITYWFHSEFVPQSNWIELDRRVRAFTDDLLVEPVSF